VRTAACTWRRASGTPGHGNEAADPATSAGPANLRRGSGQSTIVFVVAELAALYTAWVFALNFGPCMAFTPE
jgi:hypothetical protein